tara:strand:+ start:39 stop:800 length:762 start_codon:yes stop_codon:yes gene_type:complete
MANGLVTYRGHDLDRGDLVPSATTFEYFEDFTGTVTLGINSADTDGGNRGIAEYPGVLVSTAGTDATKTAVADGATVGGSVSFTTASDAVEGLSVPTCAIDPDGGDWFIETRVKVNTLEATGHFRFGLQEDVSVTDTMSQDDGAAGEDQISMFYNSGSTTDGLLEYLISKNTDETVSGADGIAGAQMASDTFARLGMEYNSSTSKIYFYFNGKEVASAATTYVSDQILHPFIAASHDAMGAITVDYIYVRASR